MTADIEAAVAYVQAALRDQADPAKARAMAAYMKTNMPFYGVQKPGRTGILRHLSKELAPVGRDEYEALASSLWELPHREEKYLAQAVAVGYRDFIVPDSLSLYENSSSRVPGGTSSTRRPLT